GEMGQQLFTVIYKRRIETRTKSGKRGRDKWERRYRAPLPVDDNSRTVCARLEEKLPEWEALDFVPGELIADPTNYERGHRLYGMMRWRDLFSPRQLLCHGTSIEVFHDMLKTESQAS